MQSIIEELAVEEWEEPEAYTPSYNIAPTQASPVLIQTDRRIVRRLYWGLIPSWAKDRSRAARMINARAETLLEKPAFRSLVDSRRCVVIADGYYEWQRRGSRRQPYYFHSAEGRLLTLAGLWDLWISPEGEPIRTYTVITTASPPEIASIHHRMPVILPASQLKDWLDIRRIPPAEALHLLQRPTEKLDVYPVSTLVNSPRNNSPQCIQALKPPLPGAGS